LLYKSITVGGQFKGHGVDPATIFLRVHWRP
jgi:hypothetical protein